MNYLAFLLEGQQLDLFLPITMIVMLIAMWWFSSSSQKKRDKEIQDMRDSLQVGDEVTTIGGIIGKVVSIKEGTFVLETTREKTHIRFHKSAISSIDVSMAELTGAVSKGTSTEETNTEEAPKKFSFFGRK